MSKRTNWYLEGWRYEETITASGSRRRKLVYHGEYYALPLNGEKARAVFKIVMTALVLLLCVAYVIAFTLAKSGAPRVFVGACMLIVIPMMYLFLGVGCLLPVGEKLTYRDFHGSFVRIRWSAFFIAILSAIGFLGAGVSYALGGERAESELLWLAEILVCCLCALALIYLEKRYRPRLIPPELK